MNRKANRAPDGVKQSFAKGFHGKFVGVRVKKGREIFPEVNKGKIVQKAATSLLVT